MNILQFKQSLTQLKSRHGKSRRGSYMPSEQSSDHSPLDRRDGRRHRARRTPDIGDGREGNPLLDDQSQPYLTQKLHILSQQNFFDPRRAVADMFDLSSTRPRTRSNS